MTNEIVDASFLLDRCSWSELRQSQSRVFIARMNHMVGAQFLIDPTVNCASQKTFSTFQEKEFFFPESSTKTRYLTILHLSLTQGP